MKKLLLALAIMLSAGLARGQVVNGLCTGSTVTGCNNATSGVTADTTTADVNAIDCSAGWVCDAHAYAATTSTSSIWLDCKGDITDTTEPWYPCYQGATGSTAGIVDVGNEASAGHSAYITLARAGYYRVRATVGAGTVYVKFLRYKR